jgi:hypothetical protein
MAQHAASRSRSGRRSTRQPRGSRARRGGGAVSAGMWRRLAGELRSASTAVEKDVAKTKRGLIPDWWPRTEAASNVRELYRLRALVDELIDDEMIRAVELGVPFSDLGTSRQQAQQRHARAVRQRALTKCPMPVRNSSTGIDVRTS